MLNIFVGFQMASDAFYSGEGEAAVEMMERLLAAVEDYNEEIADVDMEYDIEADGTVHRRDDLERRHSPRGARDSGGPVAVRLSVRSRC